jgi:hypothetical protein
MVTVVLPTFVGNLYFCRGEDVGIHRYDRAELRLDDFEEDAC